MTRQGRRAAPPDAVTRSGVGLAYLPRLISSPGRRPGYGASTTTSYAAAPRTSACPGSGREAPQPRKRSRPRPAGRDRLTIDPSPPRSLLLPAPDSDAVDYVAEGGHVALS